MTSYLQKQAVGQIGPMSCMQFEAFWTPRLKKWILPLFFYTLYLSKQRPPPKKSKAEKNTPGKKKCSSFNLFEAKCLSRE